MLIRKATWNSLAHSLRSVVYRATLNMSEAEIFIKMTARDTHEIDFLSSILKKISFRFKRKTERSGRPRVHFN